MLSLLLALKGAVNFYDTVVGVESQTFNDLYHSLPYSSGTFPQQTAGAQG